MATKKELIDYHNKLEEAIKEDTISYDDNSDRSHNAVIMSLLFKYASSINMFCGELSIFRKGFQDHVSNEISEDNYGKSLMDEMFENFRNFISNKNNSLNIILENSDDTFWNDLVDNNTFKEALKVGNLKLYSLSNDISYKNMLSHFLFSNKLARLEQDKVKHTALCTINDKSILDKLEEKFSTLKYFSTKIDG